MYFLCFHFGNICLFQVFYTIIPIYTVSRDVIGYGISSEELKELHTAQLDELKKNFFKTPIQKSSPTANDSDDYLVLCQDLVQVKMRFSSS